MRASLLLTAAAIAAATLMAPAAQARTVQEETVQVRHAISWQRGRTWHWQDAAHVRRSPEFRGAGSATHSPGYLHWIEKRWNRRRVAAYKLAHRPTYRSLASAGGIAHEALWLCIHSGYLNGVRVSTGEGAWNANTGNGFFGGLQMTSPWGAGAYYVSRADLLSPYEQMRKAELGYTASGHSTAWLRGQWPNTAPPCLSLTY